MREAKYGELPIKAIHPDEPFFVLRGKDLMAALSVRAYLDICTDAGCPASHLEAVRKVVESFNNFRASHWELMKVPD